MARKNQYPERKYTDTHASCGKCKSMIEFKDFHKSKSGPYGITYWCKACTCRLSRLHHKDKRANDPIFKEKRKSEYLKRNYGLTLVEYREKLKAQKYICAICKVELPTGGPLTHLDHCHTTGKIRAFLCTNCNRGLGHFKDSINNLKLAITYLKSHNSSVG